jgi:hypothetical protein
MYDGDGVMSTGDRDDILERVKKLIPHRWFSWVAPYRDAVIGGLADGAAACYGLYQYAKAQSRLTTSTGPFLDVIAYDFLGRYLRRGGMADATFLSRIKATILQERVTRKGMISMLTALTGNVPIIFEPWNTRDTGAYSGPSAKYGSMGYGVGRGGYGNMNLPAQVFITVQRGGGSGVPGIAGYGTSIGGYGQGAIQLIGPDSETVGTTLDDIYAAIEATKPTGVTAWTQIN